MVNESRVLSHPRMSNLFNISIPYTTSTAPATPIFSTTVAATGARLASFAINYDSNTQVNYVFKIVITGVTIDSGDQTINTGYSDYQQLPAFGFFDPLPDGMVADLMPNSKIQVFAYYTGTSAANGLCSISVLMDNNPNPATINANPVNG